MAKVDNSNCIFCQIASGQTGCFRIFEDQDNLGFLDIFPNTEGFSVLIPKKHYQSDFTKVPQVVAGSLFRAARQLSQKITDAYDDVGRCALVIEGMMVDHLHIKVIPLHQTSGQRPKTAEASRSSQFFKTYPGYITTQIAEKMAKEADLQRVAKHINCKKE